MKTTEYLVTFRKYGTSEIIDKFYINATDINNALEIANKLTHEYDGFTYFDILVDVETY